jgi:hypothetical protein
MCHVRGITCSLIQKRMFTSSFPVSRRLGSASNSLERFAQRFISGLAWRSPQPPKLSLLEWSDGRQWSKLWLSVRMDKHGEEVRFVPIAWKAFALGVPARVSSFAFYCYVTMSGFCSRRLGSSAAISSFQGCAGLFCGVGASRFGAVVTT